MAEKIDASRQANLVFNRLSKWYLLALSAIALVLIISHSLIKSHLDKQRSDSRVVNVAGRQRMLSQKLCKNSLQLSQNISKEYQSKVQKEMRETLDLWTTSHNGLKAGDAALGLPGENSPEIKGMFEEIEPYYAEMKGDIVAILEILDSPLAAVPQALNFHIEHLLANEDDFLKGMDAIVFQYDEEAKNKVLKLRNIELYLLLIAITALLIELFFIFRPLANYVQKIVSNLTDSEQKAKKNTAEITELYEAKERAGQELRALNFAVDQAALFASTTLDGGLIYMSEKLQKFLGKPEITPNRNLAEVLSINEGEQQYINQIIRTPRSTIWNGEISISKQNEKKSWLELSIVPVNRSGVKHDYLMLFSDITARKESEIKLQKLNQEKFEEEIKLQKIRSLQIIEAQENERERIAKDMHDGIGQMLTALKFNLESINLGNTEKATQKIDQLKLQAANLIKGVRMATFNLTPPELSDYGLATALAKLCSELVRLTGENILFDNRSNFNERLDTVIETNIYRVAQEAVNNAIK
ncbi:MAG: type IV pili methyl-accepting chemotaxis transducer N-terminal domain-containing protein, partial [Bacteroidota bacterium]